MAQQISPTEAQYLQKMMAELSAKSQPVHPMGGSQPAIWDDIMKMGGVGIGDYPPSGLSGAYPDPFVTNRRGFSKDKPKLASLEDDGREAQKELDRIRKLQQADTSRGGGEVREKTSRDYDDMTAEELLDASAGGMEPMLDNPEVLDKIEKEGQWDNPFLPMDPSVDGDVPWFNDKTGGWEAQPARPTDDFMGPMPLPVVDGNTPDPWDGYVGEDAPLDMTQYAGPTSSDQDAKPTSTEGSGGSGYSTNPADRTNEVVEEQKKLNKLQQWAQDKFGWDDDQRARIAQALIQGGAATMAGDSPYALQNIGKGIGVGAGAYADERGYQDDQAKEELRQAVLEEELAMKRAAEGRAAQAHKLSIEDRERALAAGIDPFSGIADNKTKTILQAQTLLENGMISQDQYDAIMKNYLGDNYEEPIAG